MTTWQEVFKEFQHRLPRTATPQERGRMTKEAARHWRLIKAGRRPNPVHGRIARFLGLEGSRANPPRRRVDLGTVLIVGGAAVALWLWLQQRQGTVVALSPSARVCSVCPGVSGSAA